MGFTRRALPLLVAAVISTFSAACSKGDAPGSAAPSSTASPTSHPASNVAQGGSPVSIQDAVSRSISTGDPKTPNEKYEQVSPFGKDTKLMAIYLALSGDKVDDNDLLELLSPKYFNEKDMFKREEIAKVDRPRIQEMLKHFGSNRYYMMHLGSMVVDSEINGGVSVGGFVDPFDMATKTFKISHSNGCWGDLLMPQGLRTEFSKKTSEQFCSVKVPDLDIAKKIEANRAAGNLRLAAKVYFYVDDVKNNGMTFNIMRVAYEFGEGNMRNPTPIGTFQIVLN